MDYGRKSVSSNFLTGRPTLSSLIHFRRRQMARWNFPVKVEALERASCQRGLAGRRLPGWPLSQLYTTTPEDYPLVKEVVQAWAARRRGLGRRIGEAVRRICDQSRQESGNMARSVMLNRRVLEVTLSFGRGSRRGWGGRSGSHDAVRASLPHQGARERHEGTVVCARCLHVYERVRVRDEHRTSGSARTRAPRRGGSPKQRWMVHTRGRSGLILAADSGIPCNCQKWGKAYRLRQASYASGCPADPRDLTRRFCLLIHLCTYLHRDGSRRLVPTRFSSAGLKLM